MNIQEWENALRQTADDASLSNGERIALREHLKEAALNEQARGVLRHKAFEIALERIYAHPPQAVLAWLEDVNKLLLPPTGNACEHFTEAFFSPGEACVARIIDALHGARNSADICVFTITDDRITSAILGAHRRGIHVRVMTDNEKAFDEGSDVRQIARAGIEVRVDTSSNHMHHKFAIFDMSVLLTGSYNWTLSASRNNQENIIASNDAKLLRVFAQEFDRLWKQFAHSPLEG
ncbi:phospholipase D [Planctomycetaceae bacterium]|nr:phospholipase D [Planctomycetaceae bacterium]